MAADPSTPKPKPPNEDYVLCDGIETNGIAIPDLRGLMIVCTSDDYPMGETGGSDTATFTMEGTVGDCTLTIQQMPRHAHNMVERPEGGGRHHTGEGGNHIWVARQTTPVAPSHILTHYREHPMMPTACLHTMHWRTSCVPPNPAAGADCGAMAGYVRHCRGNDPHRSADA